MEEKLLFLGLGQLRATRCGRWWSADLGQDSLLFGHLLVQLLLIPFQAFLTLLLTVDRRANCIAGDGPENGTLGFMARLVADDAAGGSSGGRAQHGFLIDQFAGMGGNGGEDQYAG